MCDTIDQYRANEAIPDDSGLLPAISDAYHSIRMRSAISFIIDCNFIKLVVRINLSLGICLRVGVSVVCLTLFSQG